AACCRAHRERQTGRAASLSRHSAALCSMTAAMDPAGAAPGAWVLPVKCRLEEAGLSETRLLLLRRAHLDELHCKLGWLFNLQGRYQLKYLDRFGDLITFSSDEEFQLALNNFSPPEFRILVTPADDAALATSRSARRRWTTRPAPTRGAAPEEASKAAAAAPAAAASVLPAAAAPADRLRPVSDGASRVSAAEKPSVRRIRELRDSPLKSSPPPNAAVLGDRRAVFRPDYLRPRTATQRKCPATAPAVQASLAGYRQDVAAKGIDGSDFVHFGIECSRCGTDPLIGWRFKCSLCPNYNMCAACFHRYSHGHGFYRLP
uniref:ZZ-type domain-containing protein n=1 Tax=Macrostomum lignano TaxID=282301 RepID=A0A1I8ILX9_9PLAT